VGNAQLEAEQTFDKEFTEAVVERWRGGTSNRKLQVREELDVTEAAAVNGRFGEPENTPTDRAPAEHAKTAETPDQSDRILAQRNQNSRPEILPNPPARGFSAELQLLRARLRN
jgi:hypothetical protein